MDVKALLGQAPKIIATASASILGVLTLTILVVAVLAYALIRQKEVSERLKGAIVVTILASAVLFGYAVLRVIPARSDAQIYRLRVTIVGPNGVPVDDARVWSSLGGEPKKVAGGWQFDIPVSTVPGDGQVTIFATQESAFLRGELRVNLAADLNPGVTMQLEPTKSSTVRGIVVDASGLALRDVHVSVVGYGKEVIATDATGGFEVTAHAAEGQQVQVHAERAGYKPLMQWHPAGRTPVTLVLEKE